MTTYSGFGVEGLPVGRGDSNLTHIYGISDFFSTMFEDTEIVNLLLEATSESAASIYSRFLQLTSSISLTDIEHAIGSSIKLVILKSTDAVSGKTNTFTLPVNVVESKFIANRPLLPTSLLEDGVGYSIRNGEVVFHKDISQLSFPTRILTDGTTEYALWFVDAEIDEQMIYHHFAKLIAVDPAQSTDSYKRFVQGLYYMYVNGPVLSTLRKGLNLCLGIPLARGQEQVIDVRPYLDTDQYVVITDKNQYVLPYGLIPSVLPGDELNTSDEISQWIEIKDWVEDGEWWVNLSIPPSIIPSLPETQIDRYATAGSNFDYLMRTYLKNHTFLVNVKVSTFKNNQDFQQIADIIDRVKPLYTQAIYVWSIPYLEETLTTDDDGLVQRRDKHDIENVTMPIRRMVRDNTRVLGLAPGNMVNDMINFDVNGLPVSTATPPDCLKRGIPTFTRMNASTVVDRLFATGMTMRTGDQSVTGVINLPGQYANTLSSDKGWLSTLFNRGQDVLRAKRSVVAHTRGLTPQFGKPSLKAFSGMVPANKRVMPMYVIDDRVLKDKCSSMKIAPPRDSRWYFNVLVGDYGDTINGVAVNSSNEVFNFKDLMVKHFKILFSRTDSETPKHPFVPNEGLHMWVPNLASDIRDGDFVLGVRILPGLVGMYLVTSNFDLEVKPYKVVEDPDMVTQTVDAPMMRGMGPMLTPVYSMRGRGVLSYNTSSGAINEGGSVATVDSTYSDSSNTPREIKRDMSILRHRVTL